MSLTRAELALTICEAAPMCRGAQIQRVREIEPQTLVLLARVPGHTHTLVISTRAGLARLHLARGQRPQPPEPTPFTMLLRKWLEGARLEDIAVDPHDRIATLTLWAVDPAWEPAAPLDPPTGEAERHPAPRLKVRLVAELTGERATMVLVGPGDQVLGASRRTPGEVARLRNGATYEAPAAAPAHPKSLEVREALRAAATQPRAPGGFDAPVSQAVEELYAQAQDTRLSSTLAAELRSRLSSRLKATSRRMDALERDLGRVSRSEEFRRFGELLQGARRSYVRGSDQVVVTDYYDPEMPEIRIPLDVRRDLQANIERYFHQHRRYKEARAGIEDRLLSAMEEREFLEHSLARLTPDATLAELEALDASLRSRGLAPASKTGPVAKRAESPQALPYREFRGHHGTAILVGKGARHNDTLTTRLARGSDLWLHARDWAGAHVVLRLGRDEAPRTEDLVDAATLAAHFSKGRNDTHVEVTYTRARHVRRVAGAAPGRVTISDPSTILVRLEPERLARLLATENGQGRPG